MGFATFGVALWVGLSLRSPRNDRRERLMRILCTNDDGIHAPGLVALERIARTLSDDVWIVAPETDQSGVSHSLSLNDPLRLREIGEKHFAIKGTPTDCVIMGVRHIMFENRPDLILSGVNRGQNVAEDVSYSGTIAGAIEGTILGVSSIALSQAYGPGGRDAVKWACAEHHAPTVIEKILELGMPPNTLVNVNFPDCPPEEVIGIAVHAGPAQPGAFTARPAPGRAGQPLLLDRLREAAHHPGQRHRPLGHRQRSHFGDAAPARPHRRADPDALRAGVRRDDSPARLRINREGAIVA